ncbi:MAG: zinc-dependent peptidase [Dehalococcoidia bacterium]
MTLLQRFRIAASVQWSKGLLVGLSALFFVALTYTWLQDLTVDAVVAIGLSAALFLGSFRIGLWVVRGVQWRIVIEPPDEPVPPHWEEIIRRNVPLAGRLTTDSFQRLLKLVQAFLRKKNFEGANGFEVTDEVRVTIAAHAALLLLRLDVGLFPGLHTVIVYPEAFVGSSKEHGRRTATFGESWSFGTVVLSWDSVLHGAFDPKDGQNVAVHEFAHQLDQATGSTNGTPIGLPLSAVRPWAAVLGRNFNRLRNDARKGRRSVMDHYGAKNRAEFFAVATETFLEKPQQLRKYDPDLYETLVGFYGWDPIKELVERTSQPRETREAGGDVR